MNTYFIQTDSDVFRNFLKSKNIEFITDYPNLTGVICKDEQQLFYIGLQYGEFLNSGMG